MKFVVIDRQTGTTVGTYGTAKRARNKRDQLDNNYGGYRYFVREVLIEELAI